MLTPIYVGIDVSKDTFNVAALPGVIKTVLPNSQQGHRQLSKLLKEHNIALIVMEATGGFERPIVAELLKESLPVVVANPRQVRDFAKGMGKLAKTDAIDAEVLAKFAEIVKPAPKMRSNPKTEELSELVRRRCQLSNLRTQESNRLVTISNKQIRKSIEKMINVIDNQILQLDKIIRENIESDDGFKSKDGIIQSTPGVGPQTSAMLISNLPELGLLNRQEISALVGVAPMDRSSGKYEGNAHIFGGRKEVRGILYMAAFNAKKYNPVIRELSDRLTAKGKPYKVVLTACMHKLLIILNTMVRNNTVWSQKIYLKNT